MKTKKSKFLKAFGFSSLALLMGIAGTMAFAPLGITPNNMASASEMVESTTEQGLITPKADDPVIYTTESGLEIKYGNSLPNTPTHLTSGNLNGFPYFTTTKSGTTYTWVIIGWNPNETNTPAGIAIQDEVTKQRIFGSQIELKTNSEIETGCVLCLANTTTGTSAWTTSGTNPSGYWCTDQGYYGGPNNNLSNLINSYYTNDTFGFGTYLNSIKIVTISQQSYYYTASVSNVSNTTKTDLKMFVLGSHAVDNFKYSTYLTSGQVKLTSDVWLRSMPSHTQPYYLNTSGTVSTPSSYSCGYSKGVRPAFVMQV